MYLGRLIVRKRYLKFNRRKFLKKDVNGFFLFIMESISVMRIRYFVFMRFVSIIFVLGF